MIAYDTRLSRAIIAVTSRLQLQQPQRQYQADGLMLTSGLELMVYVGRGRIIIWRLSTSDKLCTHDKYMADSAPADDEDCDVDSYMYDNAAYDTQQVNLSTDR